MQLKLLALTIINSSFIDRIDKLNFKKWQTLVRECINLNRAIDLTSLKTDLRLPKLFITIY